LLLSGPRVLGLSLGEQARVHPALLLEHLEKVG
jgi:hypothetical protein